MIETTVDVATRAGRMDCLVTHPETGGPFPAIIVFMDIWGVREELFDIARKIAVVGYHCTVPNFYYRAGKVRFEVRDTHGRMKSLTDLDPQERETIRAQGRSLTDAMVVEDVASLLDFLACQPARTGAKGSVGYCMGGRHALCVAAAFPDHFRATASLHGTNLVTDAPGSPHRLAASYRGEVYCGFGERDEFAAPAIVSELSRAFERQPGVRYDFRIHPGAGHGYALPDRDIYDKQAANRDWEAIFPMYRRTLETRSSGACVGAFP